jgi:hypothetical protein
VRSLNSVHSLLRSNFALPWRPQTGRIPNPHRAPSMTPALGIRVRVLILTPSILSLSSLSPLHTECVIASLLHLAAEGHFTNTHLLATLSRVRGRFFFVCALSRKLQMHTHCFGVLRDLSLPAPLTMHRELNPKMKERFWKRPRRSLCKISCDVL